MDQRLRISSHCLRTPSDGPRGLPRRRHSFYQRPLTMNHSVTALLHHVTTPAFVEDDRPGQCSVNKQQKHTASAQPAEHAQGVIGPRHLLLTHNGIYTSDLWTARKKCPLQKARHQTRVIPPRRYTKINKLQWDFFRRKRDDLTSDQVWESADLLYISTIVLFC